MKFRFIDKQSNTPFCYSYDKKNIYRFEDKTLFGINDNGTVRSIDNHVIGYINEYGFYDNKGKLIYTVDYCE